MPTSSKHCVNSHKSEIIVLFIFLGRHASICILIRTTCIQRYYYYSLYYIICDCVPRAKTPLPLRKSAESHATETARPDDMGCDCTWNNICELLQHLCESYTYIPKYYMCACIHILVYTVGNFETIGIGIISWTYIYIRTKLPIKHARETVSSQIHVYPSTIGGWWWRLQVRWGIPLIVSEWECACIHLFILL